jgi:hypothetical protein
MLPASGPAEYKRLTAELACGQDDRRVHHRWLGVHRRSADRATARRRSLGARPRPLHVGGRARSRARCRACGWRPRGRGRDARRRRGLRARVSRCRDTRGLGEARGLPARQRRGYEQRPAGLRRRGRAAVRPRRHRGGAACRRPARRRRRDGAASARIARALQRHQGARRAGRRGRKPRRVRDGRCASALRMGRRRQDPAAGDGPHGSQRSFRLGRRRPPPHLDHSRREHGRGSRSRRHARAPGQRLLRHRRRACGVSRVCQRTAGDPGRRGSVAQYFDRSRARARDCRGADLGASAPPGPPAADPLRLLGLGAGVHHPDRQGARAARLCAGQASPMASRSYARHRRRRRGRVSSQK